mgnify:CR=1 FL=1
MQKSSALLFTLSFELNVHFSIKNFKKTKSRLILLHERLFLKAAAPAFQVKIENPLFHAFAASFSSASCQFCYVVLHTGEHLPSSNYGSILTEVAILWQQRLPLSIFSSVASLHDDRIASHRPVAIRPINMLLFSIQSVFYWILKMSCNNDPIMSGFIFKRRQELSSLPILLQRQFYCLLSSVHRGTSAGTAGYQGTCGIGKHCSWPTVHHGVDHVINRGVENTMFF